MVFIRYNLLLFTIYYLILLRSLTKTVAGVLVLRDAREQVADDRAAVVERADLEGQGQGLEEGGLLGGLDGHVDALVRLRVQGDLGEDLAGGVDGNAVNLGLPVVLVLQEAEELKPKKKVELNFIFQFYLSFKVDIWKRNLMIPDKFYLV